MNSILVVVAHSDDEVLGCGGTIAGYSEMGIPVDVVYMTDGVSSRGGNETTKFAKDRKLDAARAAKVLGVRETVQFEFPDNELDSIPLLKVVKCVEGCIQKFNPHTIYTHFLHDLNIDHRIVAQACLTATRPQTSCPVRELYGFEVNSSTEWAFGLEQFSPNYFQNITRTIDLKLEAMRQYSDEIREPPHPRSPECIRALAELRGCQSGLRFAEAFQMYRAIKE